MEKSPVFLPFRLGLKIVFNPCPSARTGGAEVKAQTRVTGLGKKSRRGRWRKNRYFLALGLDWRGGQRPLASQPQSIQLSKNGNKYTHNTVTRFLYGESSSCYSI